MKITVINGPNLNMLGSREPDKYGVLTLAALNDRITDYAKTLGVSVEFFQSNVEGEIVTAIQQAGTKGGIIINGGAYSHYSIAIRDALAAASAPKIEVHLTNIYAREEFRHNSVLSAVCNGVICGLGADSYLTALWAIKNISA